MTTREMLQIAARNYIARCIQASRMFKMAPVRSIVSLRTLLSSEPGKWSLQVGGPKNGIGLRADGEGWTVYCGAIEEHNSYAIGCVNFQNSLVLMSDSNESRELARLIYEEWKRSQNETVKAV